MNPKRTQNPFADDDHLVEASRAAAQASDTLSNPYAAPATPANHNTEEVGAWRDEDYLVVHRNAQLPERCLKCGCETDRQRQYKIRWYRPIDICTWTLSLRMSVCQACQTNHFWGSITSTVAGLISIVMLIATVVLTLHMSEQGSWAPWLIFPAGVLAASPLIYLSHANSKKMLLIHFIKVRDNYFWLSGPTEPFLNRLPKLPT